MTELTQRQEAEKVWQNLHGDPIGVANYLIQRCGDFYTDHERRDFIAEFLRVASGIGETAHPTLHRMTSGHPVCLTCGHGHFYENDHDLLPFGRCRRCECQTPKYGPRAAVVPPPVSHPPAEPSRIDLDAIRSRQSVFAELNRDWLDSQRASSSLPLLIREDVPALLNELAALQQQVAALMDQFSKALRPFNLIVGVTTDGNIRVYRQPEQATETGR